jgi:hypothetical protein
MDENCIAALVTNSIGRDYLLDESHLVSLLACLALLFCTISDEWMTVVPVELFRTLVREMPKMKLCERLPVMRTHTSAGPMVKTSHVLTRV